MRLNSIGNIILSEWRKLANHFPCIRVDASVVMPNHVHGMIVSESPEPNHRSYIGATRLLMAESMDDQDAVDKGLRDSRDGSPQPRKRPNGPNMNSLGTMIGQFKSCATKWIWKLNGINHHRIWQCNYYEHFIRNDLEFQ